MKFKKNPIFFHYCGHFSNITIIVGLEKFVYFPGDKRLQKYFKLLVSARSFMGILMILSSWGRQKQVGKQDFTSGVVKFFLESQSFRKELLSKSTIIQKREPCLRLFTRKHGPLYQRNQVWRRTSRNLFIEINIFHFIYIDWI